MSEVELVVDAKVEVAEGPIWHQGAIWWIDVVGGVVHRYDPGSGKDESYKVGQMIGAMVPRRRGGFVLAVRDGFAAWDGPGAELEMLAPVEMDDTGNRMNDGKCDRQGRFWASTMELGGAPERGSFYRMNTDCGIKKFLGGLTIGNGLAWSADDSRLFYIDSATQGVDVLDFDAERGTVANRRRFVNVGGGAAAPDGMTIDAEDCLWVAVFGGSQVHRFTPDGQLDRVVDMPVSNPTCCTFGGKDLKDLYITTAWHTLDDEQREAQPHAGGVYVTRPGVAGTPSLSFGG